MSLFILVFFFIILPPDQLQIYSCRISEGDGGKLINRASQKERIELITVALTNRVGKDALSHYGLDPNPKTDPSPAERGTGRSEVEVEVEPGPQAEAEVEDGLHL